MKMVLASVVLLFASIGFADTECKALAPWVGTYKLVSKTCATKPLGPTITIAPFFERNIHGFKITSAGITTDVATEYEGWDKCISENGSVTVVTCGWDEEFTCRPVNWVYEFTPVDVALTANGCTGVYKP